jgi:hypothetical protein
MRKLLVGIKKLLFPLLTLVIFLLSTIFVGAVPQASAATLVPSTQTIPVVSSQIWPGTNAAMLQVASNGDLFVVDTIAGNVIYKSVNGGLTWTACPAITGAIITDLKISPNYAVDHTIVVLAQAGGNAVVYMSTDSGFIFYPTQ